MKQIALNGLSVLLAITFTFILAPDFCNLTESWMGGFFSENYGSSAVKFMLFLWKIVSVFLLFFLSLVLSYVTLTMGMFKVMQKML